MRLKSIWQKISENGISQELSSKEIIRVRLLNQIISIGFFSVFLLIIINLLSQQTIRFLLVAGFFMATALVSIYYRKYNIAILVFCFLYPIHFTYCVIRFDGDIGEANIFMVLGFVSLVMYEGKRTIQIISTLYISCLYVLSRLYVIHYDFIPQTHARTHDDLITFPLMLACIGLLLTVYLNELKKHEKEKQQLIQNLEQANYELRTFNYIASHDIKEPIRNIGNYAGLIFRKLPNNLRIDLGDYFKTIKNSTTQLYTLIEDFAKYTTLSKDDIIEKQNVDLNELLNSVETGLYSSIRKYNGKIINNGFPTIPSSNSLLYTILKNLIENGLKYNQSTTPTVELSYHKTETHHQIIVSDNGIGISEEYHEKIFEMFKRLHHRGEYEGSGIGLAIVKLSIDKLDGAIEIKSEIDQGSTFTIALPLK